MKHPAGLLLTVLALSLPVAAAAQEPPPTQPDALAGQAPDVLEEGDGNATAPEAAAEPPQAPPPPAPRPTLDEAWSLYHQAFLAHVNGSPEASIQLLGELRERFPDHPAADRAGLVLQGFERTKADRRAVSQLARAELISFQTLHGIGVGAELCALARCDDARAVVGSLVLGGGTALTTTLLTTRGGIPESLPVAINDGTIWGLWNGIALVGASRVSGPAVAGVLMLGQALGTGGAALAHTLLDPTAGQVSLTMSGAIWANVLTAEVLGIAEFTAPPATTFGAFLAATWVGTAVGGIAAGRAPMSRGRVLMIDASGILGTLVGVAFPVVIRNGEPDMVEFFASGLAGTVVGLTAGAILTRNWDADDEEGPAVSVALSPTSDGHGGTVNVFGRW